MAAIDESFIKLFGNTSSNLFSPINTGSSRGPGQDVVTATFNPRGASHVAVENEKIAAQQKIVDDENRRQAELAQQAELQRQQAALEAQNQQIAQAQSAWDAQQQAAAATAAQEEASYAASQQAAPAPGPDPFASFYSLNPRMQQKAQRSPQKAARRGISLPPAGYTPGANPAAQPVAVPVGARPVAAPAGPRPELVVAAPVEPEKISRQELADRQVKEQEERYMADWNRQVAALGPGVKPPPTPTFPTSGGDYGIYADDMVANPYYVVPDTNYMTQSYNTLLGTSGAGVTPGQLY